MMFVFTYYMLIYTFALTTVTLPAQPYLVYLHLKHVSAYLVYVMWTDC